MRQFTALLKKELLSYYRSYFAYIIGLIYLFASTASALYFGSYLAMQDLAVFSLFYMQPVILLFIVPALTMKLWPDEYKQGTAEFLLTQPVANYKIVGAKFLASFIMCLCMSVCLIPQILYTYTWLKLDLGNVICCFAGLLLLQAFFCALGCLISAFTKHVIIAYILSVFIMALWVIVPISDLYMAYNNFLFADIGLADVLYFVLFAALFVYLNVQVLLYKRSVKKHKLERFWLVTSLGFIGVTAFLVFISSVLTAKKDFTSAKIYTPGAATLDIINNISQPINIDLYIAKDYKKNNTAYYRYYAQVKRFLTKYQKLSGKMINVNATEVEPYSALENIVLQSGLYYEDNQQGGNNYFGAILRDDNGKQEIIKYFLPDRQAYLEQDIGHALLKISQPQLKKTIGVYMDSTQNLAEFQGLMLNLENDFNVLNVTPRTYEISPLLDMLILINPKTLPTYFIYAVDQYLVNGGKVILFFDFLTENQSIATNMEAVQMSSLLDHLGILLNPQFLNKAEFGQKYSSKADNISVSNAVAFEVKNEELDVEAFIVADNSKYIGAVLSGDITSMFNENPYESSEIAEKMSGYNKFSLSGAKLALIGDVDFIEDYLIADDASTTKGPYNIIYKNDNINAVRSLIEDMLNIKQYQQFQILHKYENLQNIGQQISTISYHKYAADYEDTLNELQEKNHALYLQSNQNPDKMQQLMQVDEAGRQIAQLEKKLEKLVFHMKKTYSGQVQKIVLINVVLFPLCTIGFIFVLLYLMSYCKRKKIRRMFNE